MLRMTIGAVAALLIGAGAVRADCRFKTENAIVCTGAENAALAYRTFGFDTARTDRSNIRQILAESRCGKPYGATYASARIAEMVSQKVALLDGWADVALISVNDRDTWYVAREYLEGTCKRFVPRVYHGGPTSITP